MPTPRKEENPLPLERRLLISTEDAANLLDLSYYTASRMISQGEIPSVKIGTIIRVPMEGLKEWIRANTTMKKEKTEADQVKAALEKCQAEVAGIMAAQKNK